VKRSVSRMSYAPEGAIGNELVICSGFKSLKSAVTVQRSFERFSTVFGREPSSEMSITKHLVKLVAFVKDRIPRHSVRLAEGPGRRPVAEVVVIYLRIQHRSVMRDTRQLIMPRTAEQPIPRTRWNSRVTGTNCCNVTAQDKEVPISFCCIFQVL
jgi:hypothetical protein